MSSIDEPHFLSGKRIVVAGAGIGGLTFCIALQQFLRSRSEKIDPPPSIIVYERDTSSDAIGREGYSLAIRGQLNEGMHIFEKIGIVDQIIAESNPRMYITLFNSDFSPIIELDSQPVGDSTQPSVRIVRSKLREILLKNVPTSIPINWNCAVNSAHELENGQVLVDLSDGTQQECDLLIVADGANSVIRKALRPEHVLRFSGAISITGRTHVLDQLPSPLNKTWGGAISNNGHFLFVAPNDRTSAYWGVSYLSSTPCQPKAAGTMTDDEIDQVLDEVKERTKAFSEPLPTLLKETLRSSVAVINARDMVPFRNHGSVIFIGDAQHAVNLYSGSGASLATIDAYELADQLTNAKDLNTAIKSYDDLSVPRSTSVINMSHRTISVAHSQGIWRYIYVGLLKVMAWFFKMNHVPDQQSD